MPDHVAAALAFLQRDVLKNIVPLKMLHEDSPAITCHYLECGMEAGVLVMLPPTVFSYDAQDYPHADWIVLLSTTGPAVTEALLNLVPASTMLVFKLFDPADREVVARRFPLRRVTGFVSYTSPPGSTWPPITDVSVSEDFDERSLAIFVARGHDPGDIQRRFAAGRAVSFAIERGGERAAVCYVYQNFGPVWEIAGVYTSPEVRRARLGRSVVAAALHTLTRRGLTPRYHVNENNVPSVGLAEALGLVPFVTIEHFVCDQRGVVTADEEAVVVRGR
jgi:ribosomal protein S18 acetylase RimI-like enzyme